MKKLLCVCAVLAAAGSAFGQSINFDGIEYSQNFDSLINSGAVGWSNNSTLPGWNIFRSSAANSLITANDGTSNQGLVYSYGSAGSDERALGSVASNTTNTLTYTLVLRNNTANILGFWALSYVGEQWRDGGQPSPSLQSLVFDYRISTDATTATQLAVTGYTQVPDLTFTSPVSSSTFGVQLDGNAPGNRSSRSAEVNGVEWAPGSFLILRWQDRNDGGNDHGLSIDDLRFNAFIPTPGGVGLAALALVATAGRRRR